MSRPPTLSIDEACRHDWDVVVVGAGPAGALAALGIARRDASVLLIDQASFPRQKICGCCLNPLALATLASAELDVLQRAIPLHACHLAAGSRAVRIPLAGYSALSRHALDDALIDAAIRVGAEFLPETTVVSHHLEGSSRRLVLRRQHRDHALATRLLVLATGLDARLLRHEPRLERRVSRSSRVGLGATVENVQTDYAPGTIFMACGPGGYVGLVRLEDGRLNIAAAMDPAWIHHAGGPDAAVAGVLQQADLPLIRSTPLWRGTPRLTCRSLPIAAERLLLVGDAASYVEPFTGEGIAWALASGAGVVSFALAGARRWEPSLPDRWMRWHRRRLGARQQTCQILTALMRHAGLTRAVVAGLSRMPNIAAPLVRRLGRPLPALG